MTSPEPQTVREILDDQGWPYVEIAARQLHGGIAKSRPNSATDRQRFQHGMLRWALSDDAGSRRDWSVLAASGDPLFADRDRYVAEVWKGVETSSEHASLRSYIDQHFRARDVYRDYLFRWFLRRFDFRRALELYGVSGPLGLLYLVTPVGLALICFAVAVGLRFDGQRTIPLAVVCLALWFGIWALVSSEKKLSVEQIGHLVVPRLGAGLAIGYLFLGAAPHLVEQIAREDDLHAGLVAILLIGVTALYTAFDVSRRVHPTPRLSHLVRRTGLLLGLGLSYALLGLALLGPLLHRIASLDGTLGLAQSLLLASVALALGMVLELAWEEKPLTEPL